MAARSWRGVVQHFRQQPLALQRYFLHVPALAETFPWDVCLAYQFARVELAHNMAIYCGVVKLHRAHPELAWRAVQSRHLTRDSFRQLFATVHGKELPKSVSAHIEGAEKVRDGIMHGKSVGEATKRTAVCEVMDYARTFNEFASQAGGVRPFGDLRGFKGRAKSLDKATSHWLLKGLGLPLS